MKKRILKIAAIFFLMLLFTAGPVFSPVLGGGKAEEGIRVKINDVFLSLPQSPVRIEGTTLLPFRPIYEFLGATIFWDKNTNTVIASRGAIKVELQLENGMAIVNNEKVILNVAPSLINGATMVPAWFFTESLGAEVDWDAQQQVLNISLASVSGINLETRELTLEQGESQLIAAIVYPDNAINKNIEWDSTFPSVAGVNKASETEAVVSAVNPGTAIIIAATEDGDFVETCKVTVKQAQVPVTGIYLNTSSLTLLAGGRPALLTASVYPETATNKNITWKSSKPAAASVHKNTVSSSMVVPLKEGETTIYAITEDGEYAAVCAVKVLP